MDPEDRSSVWQKLKSWFAGNDHQDPDVEKEIQELLEEGEARGLITQQESYMIEAVLELGETTAGQIMTPRTSLCTIAVTATIPQVVETIGQTGHSRIPVYETDLDHIIGILHAKDLLSHWGRSDESFRLQEVIRQPIFVPQSMPIEQLLATFNRQRAHLAVVVDEYGGTAGIVTMEDVLEEIVGDIKDEHDLPMTMLQVEPDGSYLVDGRLEVEELSEVLQIELPEELPEGRFESVGGFVTTLLGRLPKAKEEVFWGPLRLLVEEADQRKVNKVRVSLLPPQQEADQVA